MTESADVTLDDLNEEQLQVVEVIGLEAYKRLIHYYAGTSIYIPKFSEIERRKRNEKIRIEYEKKWGYQSTRIEVWLIRNTDTNNHRRFVQKQKNRSIRRTSHIV